MHPPYLEHNREVWDLWTHAHYNSSFYDVKTFLRGRSSLNSVEREEIGDVHGRNLLHLQCHFGLDTISFARLGATVTGVDFSEASIRKARELSRLSGIDARFIHSDLYDLPAQLHEQFDVVFTSYGVLNWLPDLRGWAQCIARMLRKGGLFYMVEFHPVLWTFDDEFRSNVQPYDNAGVMKYRFEGTYADRHAEVRGEAYCWNHGIGSVHTALREVGLKIDMLREHPYSPYNIFPRPVEVSRGWWAIEDLQDKIPMLYSIRAKW